METVLIPGTRIESLQTPSRVLGEVGSERILDVGCGHRKTPGSIGMDVLADSAADVLADLSGPWPFQDHSFDRIVASHVLEHVPDVVHVMEEAYRVLRVGGRFLVRGPHFSCPHIVWSDPTHRRALSIGMFLHFQPGTAHPYSKTRFRIARAKLYCAYPPPPGVKERWFRKPLRHALTRYEEWVNSAPIHQQRAERMFYRAVQFPEVEVELEALPKS
jgi:SAM-dependent methyltransferase